MLQNATTYVARLRIRATDADPQAVGSHAAAMLRTLDLQPPGISPQAVLCVRELRDPLPGGIELRSTSTRPTRWEAAVRAALSGTLSRAARPAFGPVSQSAEAVFFADRAELLACAARDACRGMLGSWWWQHLLRDLTFHQVTTEWLRAPAYVPAALEMLAASHDAVAFVGRLDAARAVELTITTLQIHRAEVLARAISQAMQTATSAVGADISRTIVSGENPLRVCEKFVPEFDDETLTIEQRIFATTTLMLRKSPEIIAAPHFARQLVTWIEFQTAPEKPAPTRTSSPVIPSSSRTPETTPTVAMAPPAEFEQPPISHQSLSDATSAPDPPHHSSATSDHEIAHEMEHDIVPSSRERHFDHESGDAPDRQRDVTLPVSGFLRTGPVAETAMTSSYGGLFFLLNAAFALGYYGNAFKEPEQPLELNVWDFLALCGRRIAPAIVEDPVWALLEQLANRQEPLRETDGFDERIFAPIQKRIGLALTVDTPDLFLVSRLAHITQTPVHLDISFPLRSHPIEIRMAGLDRDPGWIPAAGRYVSYHFD